MHALSDTIKLLRIPFSFFLMPVFLFALSQVPVVNYSHACILFVVLHLFIYPASNAYNSYMDQDEGPIGGLEHPPKATRSIFYLSAALDVVGIALSSLISPVVALGVLLYVLASRAYSYTGIRLKKFPIAGYITVVFFQGAFTYALTFYAVSNHWPHYANAVISSLLIGGVYPLTQIYQHDEDRKNGDTTLSILLGYRGTFVFTAILFTAATALMFLFLPKATFIVIQACMLPVVSYFFYWVKITWNNTQHADFKHTMRMNTLASLLLNLCFMLLFTWYHLL
jgi:1,4-dihydroxy-2-naphthoate octaprenyltransferase